MVTFYIFKSNDKKLMFMKFYKIKTKHGIVFKLKFKYIMFHVIYTCHENMECGWPSNFKPNTKNCFKHHNINV